MITLVCFSSRRFTRFLVKIREKSSHTSGKGRRKVSRAFCFSAGLSSRETILPELNLMQFYQPLLAILSHPSRNGNLRSTCNFTVHKHSFTERLRLHHRILGCLPYSNILPHTTKSLFITVSSTQ